MSDPRQTRVVPTAPHPLSAETVHPHTFAPATFILIALLSVFGAVIGVQLIVQLGVTPNTSIIGALVAMLLARVPLALFARYRSIHVQNLAQSAISAATFGAGEQSAVADRRAVPAGTAGSDHADAGRRGAVDAARRLLALPHVRYAGLSGDGTWPPGIAAAEAIRAGDAGGRRALLLGAGLLVGIAGSWLKVPMSAFGVAFIGNVWALGDVRHRPVDPRLSRCPVAGHRYRQALRAARLHGRRRHRRADPGRAADRPPRHRRGACRRRRREPDARCAAPWNGRLCRDRGADGRDRRPHRRALDRHADRLRRLCRLRRLRARADRRHRGNARRLVPGFRGGADHADRSAS